MFRLHFLAALLLALLPARAADAPLNFLVILIDDMGVSDLGCQGSTFYETPHIDRLASEGARFTHAYSACTVCSPTRAALMTGKHPARLHVTDWIAGHEYPKAKLAIPAWTKELPLETTTIAEALRTKGYTSAHFGKWHLRHTALEHGFDFTLADNGRGQPETYLSPYKIPNFPDGPEGEELTDRLTHEAGQWIEKQKDKPWLVYLSHYNVHTPLGAKPELIEKYRAKAKRMKPQGRPPYAAMVETVDTSVGAIRAKLESLGILERTVIVFTSDNGGLENGKNPVTDNLGVRAGKGSPYEGGVRIPAIVRWPGITKPGIAIPTPMMPMDWPASIAAASGASLPCDGVDIRPLLRGETIADRDQHWHYPHYHPGGSTPYSAIRSGALRLLHFYEDDRIELYDIAADPEESRELSAERPADAARLRSKLDAWLKETGAQLPTSNPNYDPAAK